MKDRPALPGGLDGRCSWTSSSVLITFISSHALSPERRLRSITTQS